MGYVRGKAYIQLTYRLIEVKTRDTMFNDFCERVRTAVAADKPTYINLDHDNDNEKPTKFISNKIEAMWFEGEK